MYRCRDQHCWDEQDVEGIEALVVVVSEGTEGEGDQERERDERLETHSVPSRNVDHKSGNLQSNPKGTVGNATHTCTHAYR